MTRSFRYRLKPSRAQAATLLEWLRLTRELYNAALQERRDAWAKQRKSVSRIDQEKQLPAVRSERPEFSDIPIVVQRGALRRLDKAFAAFFRRCKTGELPGYPRFKSARRWSSLLLDDLGQRSPLVAGGKRVAVPLLGKVKLHIADDRSLCGTPKALRLTFDLGKWYVTFACVDVPAKPLPATGKTVGIDLGLLTFAATSDGEMFDNPRPMRTKRIAVERAQRRVTRRKRGSKRRRIAARTLARRHAHVAGIRREHHITIARTLVARYDTIYVEDLNVRGLAAGMLAKSVNDAGWGEFRHWLACKAEDAGRQVIEVHPRGTSQMCSSCGCVAVEHLSLAIRVFRCAACGLVLDRDVNAARNIKGLGLAPQGAALPPRRRRRSATPRRDDRVTTESPFEAKPCASVMFIWLSSSAR